MFVSNVRPISDADLFISRTYFELDTTAVPNTFLVSASKYDMHLVRHMKSSASETKPFQSRSRVEIFGQARRKERLSRSKLK